MAPIILRIDISMYMQLYVIFAWTLIDHSAQTQLITHTLTFVLLLYFIFVHSWCGMLFEVLIYYDVSVKKVEGGTKEASIF